MPRIDPLSLLKCLSVLLGPTGGIKSKEEVHRLANLMTKFSKKLVSKCIYIQILKTTNTDLLSQFMAAGGWNLIHMWLTDGILTKNWALIQELLELLLLCPVDIERLKSNNCPKLIKGLSKEGSHQGVRVLAGRLVEQWLKIVKGEAAPNSVPAQITTVPVQSTVVSQGVILQPSLQQQQYSLCGAQQLENAESTATQDIQYHGPATTVPVTQVQQQVQEEQQQGQQQHVQERVMLQPVQLQVVGKPQQQGTVQKRQSFVVVSTSSQSPVPVYKITIRDGKQVLTKVETDATNINSVIGSSGTSIEVNGDATDDVLSTKESAESVQSSRTSDGVCSEEGTSVCLEHSDKGSSEVKQIIISSKDNHDSEAVKNKDYKDSKDITNSDSNKSSDKENRDSHKRDEKKSSSSSSDKKSSNHHSSSSSSSKSSSKHSTSSSSHRTSSSSHKSSGHRSSSSSSSKSSSSKDKSSRDKEKHPSNSSSKHSSSSKSKSERDKEKEKQKKDQAEKDKATLEKVQGQALSSKLGKIPKKKTEEEKPSDASAKRVPSESKDGLKENKDKTDAKKAISIPEKKNISISIESRKNSQEFGTRPKTVKTYNSKFRSTGLEEEVKPPPPRSAKKLNPTVDKKVVPPKIPLLKRPSPLKETAPSADKRPRLSLDSPTTPPSEEKKGGIKLIPPKPKPMVLQESDMFMDALTASTKSKEPRKRKRRTSITKEGPSEAKKLETSNDSRETTPPPGSSPSADEKSPVVMKPNLKFYQDTLETEEDKEQKEKENIQDDKKDKEDLIDDNRDINDDDVRSNTPTPEDDVEDTKASDSPEDQGSEGSDSSKKDSVYSEIRYVDGLRSVLLLQKRKGPKKTLKWKTDLESIRYFELDETERVNVTKTFTDMKQMEKQNEREAFQMARKLSNEDLMEEKTRWKPLIPIDLPPPLVEPGKDSREKDIQYAREKGILQALYFNRSMIPDSAAEPDEERHHVITDPKIIPLDDLTGNKESEKDFTSMAWPEPKPQLPPQTPTMTNFHYPTFPHNQQPMMTPMGPQNPMGGPMPQMPQPMMPPAHMGQMGPEISTPMAAAGGGWRTGDGKVVVPDVGMNPMANMPGAFPQGMEGGPMVPPGMMGPPPMFNQQQDGYMMGPEDMGFNNMNPNNFQGPPGPMFGPGPGPNFQGPRGMMHNRGRGGPGPGPGWFRGGGGPGRGGWRGGGGGWRGSGKQPPVCRQFSKNGYCRVGEKCQYLHPGVNCPPF